jgi:protein SCO1/2
VAAGAPELVDAFAGCGAGRHRSLACTPADKPRSRALDVSGAAYGRDFRLTDPQGRERSLADFRGKVVMLFFGFVQCADVCPAAHVPRGGSTQAAG